MLGECAFCGGRLSSETAWTAIGQWKYVYTLARDLPPGILIWCSVVCLKASANNTLVLAVRRGD